ncbi:MAG TPA: sugar ABC transporter permease [Geminicoccaceae bacterium]|nr:sugar ABC transporter permease [Geminicoccus sp.]HMU52131.1 sugar ABC transporter permease [Geminicoccaceae bacterium]
MRWTGRIRHLFLMPAVVWVVVFTIFPTVYSLYSAFHTVTSETVTTRSQEPMVDAAGKPQLRPDGTPRTRTVVNRETVNTWQFVGLDNFARMGRDPVLLEAVRVTAIFVAAAVSAEMILGLFLAFVFNRSLPGRSLMRTIMILPIFATPVAAGYLFFTIFYEEGGPLGWTNIPWLSDPSWALVSVIIVDVWQWTPFCFLVLLAGLQGIPDEMLESARLDTNSTWDLWRLVILPMLQPVIIIVLLLRIAEALKVFDVVASLTVGGPGNATQSLSYLAFRTGLRFFDVGYASAIAWTLLAFVMVVVTLFFKRVRSVYA